MKKLYVDHIKKEGDKSLPGPGRYEHSEHFGKKGLSYIMGARLPTEK